MECAAILGAVRRAASGQCECINLEKMKKIVPLCSAIAIPSPAAHYWPLLSCTESNSFCNETALITAVPVVLVTNELSYKTIIFLMQLATSELVRRGQCERLCNGDINCNHTRHTLRYGRRKNSGTLGTVRLPIGY